jgi:purine-binding chemotaxis protein CheW
VIPGRLAREPIIGTRWVLFALDDGRYALPLESVVRIVRAAGVTPLPLAPDAVLGALDVAGDILPVFDLRRRFQRPSREIRVDDQFIVANTSRRRVILAVDATLGVRDESDGLTPGGAQLEPELAASHPSIGGILSFSDGIVLIQDLERFLSPDEDRALEVSLASWRDAQGRGRAR